MAVCKRTQRTKTIICAGSLNNKIDLYTRDISAPLDAAGSSINYDETFTLLATVWSMIETPKGQTIFDEIGIERVIDTIFYIRYRDDITSENWVEFESNRYDIRNIVNLEHNNLFLQLNCELTGAASKEASKA